MARAKPKKPLKFTESAQKIFLAKLAETGLLGLSARAAGVCRETVRLLREADPEFQRRVDDANADHNEIVVEEIIRRGVHGWENPRFNAEGEITGIDHKYSDRMLELYAKRRMPEFREKQQLDVNHSGGVLVVPATEETAEKWEKRAKSATHQR